MRRLALAKESSSDRQNLGHRKTMAALPTEHLFEEALKNAKETQRKAAETVEGLQALAASRATLSRREIEANMREAERGNTRAMNRLARHYEQQGDEATMRSFYLAAVAGGNVNAMVYMGNHHFGRNPTEMEKFYLMAIDRGSNAAMENLGTYFNSLGRYPELKHYYMMAIENGNPNAAEHLRSYEKDHRIEVAFEWLKSAFLCRGDYRPLM